MNSPSLKLIASNPTFQSKDGFYSLPRDENEVKVVFSDAGEEAVAAQLSGLDDASSFSSEVEALVGNGEHINVLRPQSLLAFDFSNITTALEISNDYGNVCRALAENIDVVESIKTNASAARATAYRCADLVNVGIINAGLDDINIPDKYYDLIVLSDIELIADDKKTTVKLISRLSDALTANGLLVLNVQNPQPISAWFNQEQSIPYAGLYGTLSNRLDQSEWIELLDGAGLSSNTQHCVLPNSHHPRTLLSKDYTESNPGAVNHFYGAGFTGSSKVNEYLLFRELSKTRNLYELCDSYLIIASRSEEPVSSFYNSDFSHFSSPGRRPEWRTITNKSNGSDVVNKQALFAQESKLTASNSGITLAQDLEPQNYQIGQSLAGLWLESLVHQNSSDTFCQHIKDYSNWLESNADKYQSALYDLLPFNLIVDQQGEYQVIDPEWHIETGVSPQFVLFRALFWFGFHNLQLLQNIASENGLFSLSDFVDFGFKLTGYQSDWQDFIQLENNIQNAIEKQFNTDAIDQTLRLPITGRQGDHDILLQPKAQVLFYDKDSDFDFANSVALTTTKIGVSEKLSFSVTNIDVSLNALRIDPVDRGGFFRISDLQIKGNDDLIWSLETEREIVAAAKLKNAVYADSHLGCLFIALNEDPQLLFDLSSIAGVSEATTIDFTLMYYSNIDYNLAMQQLGQDSLLQQQFISSQRNELESYKARMSELNDNFEFLKLNSEKQHDLIEQLQSSLNKQRETIEKQQDAIQDQQQVIDNQVEMMNRTPSARVKLFLANKLGKVDEAKEAEQQEQARKLEQAKKERESKPVKLGQNNEDYALWIKKHELNSIDIQRIKTEIEAMAHKPTFSIVVPVYNIDEEFLMMAVDSVRNQLYPFWQLCLVDDASPDYHIRPMLKRLTAMDERIVVKLNKNNQGIAGASNDAVELTNGDYVGLLDHDDELSIDALYENAKVINEFSDVGLIYSDEDKVTMEGVRVDPYFKPDYSPDLLDSNNYVCHFSVISQKVIEKIGAFRLGFDGSQDHDLIMRAIHHAGRIVHIPKVLYHWRKVPGSTADVYDAKNYAWEAGRKAVEARFNLNDEAGEVVFGPLQGTYQIKRNIVGSPKVSIIIPFKDKPDLLEGCLESILRNNDYTNFEVIGVSNNSEEPRTHELMQRYQTEYDNIRFVDKNVPFNFSQLCNYGVSESNGDYVLLLNNDIEVRSTDWLERLLEHAQRDDVGAVGGKLFFPDGRIQHAGVVVGMHEAAGHSHLYFSGDSIGYYGSLMITRDVSAVTGAMLMVSRKKYDEVSGLDEQNLAVAYNDVDLCLKLVDKGYRNIFTPFVHAVHYESASRGYEDNPEKIARLEKERNHFVSKWQSYIDGGDPCFNPNFDLDNFDFKIKL